MKCSPEPTAYADLKDPDEIDRLNREVLGYLRTCLSEHHGTDLKGRQFAIKALEMLVKEAK